MKRKLQILLMVFLFVGSPGFSIVNNHYGLKVIHVSAENRVLNKAYKKPKNIIFLIGDGMGIGQMEIARLFEYGKEGRLFMQTLPHLGLVQTYSANNFVTDSAAGATALATGHKTNNGMIGVTPDGKEAKSILDLFKEHGKKVGVISTNTVTDATPAAFTASVNNRWSGQAEIARQQLKNQIDVILGGGASMFKPENQNGIDLIDQFKQKGYTYVTGRGQLQNVKGEKILGLFHPSYMTFKQDRDELRSNEPDLKLMAQKAIETLSIGNKGFFVMIEGARIDHAAHSADIPGIWKEMMEFDQTVEYAVKWAEKQGDTLVVVAADHETMGISAPEPLNVEAYKKIKVSPEYMAAQLVYDQGSQQYTIESIRDVFYRFAGISLSDSEAQKLNTRLKSNSGKVYASKQTAWEIGSLIAEYMNAGILDRKVRAQSPTGGHTANMIPIFSFGPGAKRFEGVINNTDIPRNMADLMGYHF